MVHSLHSKQQDQEPHEQSTNNPIPNPSISLPNHLRKPNDRYNIILQQQLLLLYTLLPLFPPNPPRPLLSLLVLFSHVVSFSHWRSTNQLPRCTLVDRRQRDANGLGLASKCIERFHARTESYHVVDSGFRRRAPRSVLVHWHYTMTGYEGGLVPHWWWGGERVGSQGGERRIWRICLWLVKNKEPEVFL